MSFNLFRYIPRNSSASKLSLSLSSSNSPRRSPPSRKLSPRSFVLVLIRPDFRWVLERESSDTQLSVSPNDLSWLFGPCVHVKTFKRQSNAAVTQQNKPNALGKRTLVSGRYDWSNCYNSLLMFFQIRWCYCLRSIRDQNGANNSNAFLKLFFVGQYKGI